MCLSICFISYEQDKINIGKILYKQIIIYHVISHPLNLVYYIHGPHFLLRNV